MNVELKIPFAIDINKKEVYPEKAEKGIEYFCPDCHEKVILRAGEVRRPHFSHKIDTTIICDFVNESEKHYRAKQRVLEVIEKGIVLFKEVI